MFIPINNYNLCNYLLLEQISFIFTDTINMPCLILKPVLILKSDYKITDCLICGTCT